MFRDTLTFPIHPFNSCSKHVCVWELDDKTKFKFIRISWDEPDAIRFIFQHFGSTTTTTPKNFVWGRKKSWQNFDSSFCRVFALCWHFICLLATVFLCVCLSIIFPLAKPMFVRDIADVRMKTKLWTRYAIGATKFVSENAILIGTLLCSFFHFIFPLLLSSPFWQS